MQGFFLESQYTNTGCRPWPITDIHIIIPYNYNCVEILLETLLIRSRLNKEFSLILQGNCAENTASELEISREEQDQFAISSYKKTEAAWQVINDVYQSL